MISRLVIFGATGDLTARFLLEGIASLQAAGELPDGFSLTGVSREDWDDDGFRKWAAAQLDRFAGDLPEQVRQSVVAVAR